MWGIGNRGARLDSQPRANAAREPRSFVIGLVRLTLRGPASHTIVELEGELDFTSADEVARLLQTLPHRIVGIDMQRLQFIDSAGVFALTQVVDDRTAQMGGTVTVPLLGLTPHVQRTFDLVAERSHAHRVSA